MSSGQKVNGVFDSSSFTATGHIFLPSAIFVITTPYETRILYIRLIISNLPISFNLGTKGSILKVSCLVIDLILSTCSSFNIFVICRNFALYPNLTSVDNISFIVFIISAGLSSNLRKSFILVFLAIKLVALSFLILFRFATRFAFSTEREFLYGKSLAFLL